MTYGDQLFINRWGDYLQGEGQEKYCCVKGGVHYLKNKNIGGMCQINLISKKGNNAKMRKKISNIENFSRLVSLTRHFTKFIFLEQLTAMPQYNMQKMFFILFF